MYKRIVSFKTKQNLTFKSVASWMSIKSSKKSMIQRIFHPNLDKFPKSPFIKLKDHPENISLIVCYLY